MTLLYDSGSGRIDAVLHPTDLSEASERAFHHALAIAIRTSAQFTLLHAIGRRATDNWVDFPSVRSKLAEWRAAGTTEGLEERIRRSSISKREMDIRDPVAACKEYLSKNGVDLIVLATEGRSGLSRLLRPSRAERLARESRITTLFVPEGARLFVNGGSGEVTLKRILVPVDSTTDPRPAMLQAVRSAELLDDPSLEITLLNVGDDEEESVVSDLPELPYCRWNAIRRTGAVVDGILGVAEELSVDAICMATGWNKPGLGRTEGGVTERVLAGAPCPVFTVPAGRS